VTHTDLIMHRNICCNLQTTND